MSVITVLYPTSGGSRFDTEYYLATHISLVRDAWGSQGLVEAQVLLGQSGPDGSAAPYHAITNLIFADAGAMGNCLGGARAGEVNGDIAHFTDTVPVIQFGRLI